MSDLPSKSSLNILIIAGEKSGEEHALTFLGALQRRVPNLKFFGVGGDEMAKQGVELLYHLREFSSWGFAEIISKIPFYFRAFFRIKREVRQRSCRYAILIDFQEFNYNLSRSLKKEGVTIFYYVAPQAWVWRQYRAHSLARSIHTLFTILPFEKCWFQERGVERVVSLPHPLLLHYGQDLPTTKTFCRQHVVILPGSRRSEISRLLPLFVQVMQQLKKSNIRPHFTLVTADALFDQSLYAPYVAFFDEVVTSNQIASILKRSDLAIAASGTVTLLCALYRVPTIVAYRLSWLSKLAYQLLVPYRGPVALPNIIFNRYLFPELLQEQANVQQLVQTFLSLWQHPTLAQSVMDELVQLPAKLQGDRAQACSVIAQTIERQESERGVRAC